MRPPGVWAKAERTFFHLRVPARTLRLCVWTFRPCASFRHADIPNLLSGGPSAGGCVFFFSISLAEALLGTLILGEYVR